MKPQHVKIREQCLQAFPNWQPPNTEEIRCVLREAGLTGAKAGALVGVEGRTVRRWTGGDAAIPYAAWAILCDVADLQNIWNNS